MSPSGEEVQVDVEGRTLTISNLGKVLYPRTGTTKGEVLNYYAQVAPVLLPHLADRAVTRIRWPHGVERSSFFEKNAPAGTPSWVRTAEVPTTGSRSGKGEGTIRFPICDDLATLTWLANHLSQRAIGLKAGDIVTTGTCTTPPAIAPGDRVVAEFVDLGQVRVAFN